MDKPPQFSLLFIVPTRMMFHPPRMESFRLGHSVLIVPLPARLEMLGYRSAVLNQGTQPRWR